MAINPKKEKLVEISSHPFDEHKESLEANIRVPRGLAPMDPRIFVSESFKACSPSTSQVGQKLTVHLTDF